MLCLGDVKNYLGLSRTKAITLRGEVILLYLERSQLRFPVVHYIVALIRFHI